MSDNDEWGPWIEHDGLDCPVAKGVIAQTIAISPINAEIISIVACVEASPNWNWHFFGKRSPEGSLYRKIIRYRIRKPRGLTILEGLLENLPSEVDA
jgi:hypothetical protein